MSNVSLIDGHIDEPRMTTEKAIKMIDEYLAEPNSIHKDWVECLRLCRQALEENDRQKAEIERLIGDVTTYKIRWVKAVTSIETAKSEAIKEFWKKIKSVIKKHICFFTPEDESELIQYGDNLVKEMVGD